MQKNTLWAIVGAGLLCLARLPACGNSVPMFNECPAVGQDTGCAVLITINSGGSLSFQSDPSQPSFDPAGDDTLVGVLNNSGALTYDITLSGNNIFQFDFDGACSGIYSPSPSRCPDPFNAPTSYEGYDKSGNFDSFSPSSLDSGMIFFANGLTAGDSAFFSLQGTPADITTQSTVPEPGSLLLVATGLAVLIGLSLKRKLEASPGKIQVDTLTY